MILILNKMRLANENHFQQLSMKKPRQIARVMYQELRLNTNDAAAPIVGTRNRTNSSESRSSFLISVF
jgi:hypothetical protein